MMPFNKCIDDCLSTRNRHLFVEECNTLDLVKKFGSPLFILSENQIRRNIRRFQKAFQQGWPDGPVKVLPAAKANWISAVQRIIADEGCGCDIYSLSKMMGHSDIKTTTIYLAASPGHLRSQIIKHPLNDL